MDNPSHYTIYKGKWERVTCVKPLDNYVESMKLYTYLLFDSLYLTVQFIVGFQFILNLIHTVDNCSVVFFAEQLADIDV